MDGTSIIIFGGQDSAANYLNDIWLLNVNTFQWTSPNASGSPPAGGLYGANGKKCEIVVCKDFSLLKL